MQGTLERAWPEANNPAARGRFHVPEKHGAAMDLKQKIVCALGAGLAIGLLALVALLVGAALTVMEMF